MKKHILQLWCAVLMSSCQLQLPEPLRHPHAVAPEWYQAEEDMTHFYHVANLPQHRGTLIREYLSSPDAELRAFGLKRQRCVREMDDAAACMQRMSSQEKTILARVYAEEYADSLHRHGITEARELNASDDAKSHDISNWDGQYTRAVATLPEPQRRLLDTDGAHHLMEGYGGYMLLRYVALNPEMPQHIRSTAFRIASLWCYTSDGELGYRGNWVEPFLADKYVSE